MALILAIEEDLWRRLERYHSLTPDIWVDGTGYIPLRLLEGAPRAHLILQS
jgi:hypothetical protein